MTSKRKRVFTFALAVCLLFALLPGSSRAEQTQDAPVADAPAAVTPLDAVPATQTPTEPIELTEAETVSLSNDEVRVIKGGTTTLTAEIPEAQRGESPLTTSSAIVWTSSNPEVATVDSNGVVTGIELGEATITATLNGAVIETFTVYSTLADGYYTIETISCDYYMSPTAVSMDYGVSMYSMSKELFMTGEPTYYEDLLRKWYIKHQGGGFYSIHPAFSRGTALALDGDMEPILRQYSSMTTNEWHWKIESGSYCYVLVNRVYSDRSVAFEESDSGDAPLVGTTRNLSNSSQNWYVDAAFFYPEGLLLFNTHTGDLIGDDLPGNGDEICTDTADAYIALGKSMTLEEMGLHLEIMDSSTSSQAFTMTIEQSYATFNLSTLKISGMYAGQTAASVNRAISGTLYTVEFTLNVTGRNQVMVYSYYDDSFDATLMSYIDDAIEFVNDAFQYTGYPASFTAAYANTYNDTRIRRDYGAFDTYYEQCDAPLDCAWDNSSHSPCDNECIKHHKNLQRISAFLDGLRYPNTLQVLWTNQPEGYFCTQSSQYEQHTPRNSLAIVLDDPQTGKNRQVVHMMHNPETTSANRSSCIALLLAHEVAHTLGLGEAYEDDEHDEPLDRWDCIMERYNSDGVSQFYTAIRNGTKRGFCDDCIANLTDALT